MTWRDLLDLRIAGWGIDLHVGVLFAGLLAVIVALGAVAHRRSGRWQVTSANFAFAGCATVTICPTDDVALLAHQAWVEITTRKAALPFDEEHDVIAEIYDSWYELFGALRELSKNVPTRHGLHEGGEASQLVEILTGALNQGLRPHLTQWHTRFRRWYEDELKKPRPQDWLPRTYSSGTRSTTPWWRTCAASMPGWPSSRSHFASWLTTGARHVGGGRGPTAQITRQEKGTEMATMTQSTLQRRIDTRELVLSKSLTAAQQAVRHKCFVSFHHADEDEVETFIDTFEDAFIPRVLGVSDEDEFIKSTDTDYVMEQIREKYLTDSTVTIVLVGKCTWARRYVDWEVYSSLRNDSKNRRSGLMAVTLPSAADYASKELPPRVDDNVDGDKGYAALVEVPVERVEPSGSHRGGVPGAHEQGRQDQQQARAEDEQLILLIRA